jgi:hypothetical protein
MEDITVRVPPDRLADFFALYAAWLLAPNGATWTHTAPSSPAAQAWDAARPGEAEKASALWQALDEPQRAMIDAVVAASGKIDVAQLAVVLSLKGSVAAVQQAVAVNAAARKLERADVLGVSVQADQLVVELNGAAGKALHRQAGGAPSVPAPAAVPEPA